MFRKSVSIALASLALLAGPPATAMPLAQFKKLSSAEQGIYLAAAVSVLAYQHAANGDVPKARCIRKWMFGEGKGAEGAGIRDLMMGIAGGTLDPEKHHIEGLLIGAVDKACPSEPRPVVQH